MNYAVTDSYEALDEFSILGHRSILYNVLQKTTSLSVVKWFLREEPC